jgi:hypothetical protein
MEEKMSTIKHMLHIYRTYLAVKLVDKENDRMVKKTVSSLKNGQAPNIQVKATTILIKEADAVEKLSQKHIFFKKIEFTKAVQAVGTARKSGYLQTETHNGANYLRVEHLKGLQLIDGIPFIRPGLWKAWHQEHGWLIPLFIAAYGATLGLLTHYVKDIIIVIMNKI